MAPRASPAVQLDVLGVLYSQTLCRDLEDALFAANRVEEHV